MLKITLTNDFHNSEITLNATSAYGDAIGKLSASQVAKARKSLCGIKGCACGDDLGRRGASEYDIEPIMDNRTGAITGAWVYSR